MESISRALQDILSTRDLLEKGMKLAGLVTAVFREAGWNLVVVGGSAVEFYSEGRYMSGDIDVCRRNLNPIPLRDAQDLMAKLEATGGPRNWLVAGMYVDLLGLLENEATTPCREMETPYGTIQIVPVELVIVERTLLAFYPKPDPQAKAVACKLLAACLSGSTPVDWSEVQRLAATPSFRVAAEVEILKQEVERACTRGP